MDKEWLEQWKDQQDDGRIPFSVFIFAAHFPDGTLSFDDPDWSEAIEQDDRDEIERLCDRDSIEFPKDTEQDKRLEKYRKMFESEAV